MIKHQNPIFLICPDDSNESIKIKPNIFGQEDSDNVICNIKQITKSPHDYILILDLNIFDASCTILIANKNYLNIIDVLHILEKESIDSCTFLSINCSIRTHDNTYARNLSKLGLLFHKIGCQTKVVGFYYHYIIALSELRLSATNTPEFDQSKFNKRYLIVIDRRCFECLVTDIKDIPIYNLFLIVKFITHSISILTLYYDADHDLESFIKYLDAKEYSIDLIDDQYSDNSLICSRIAYLSYLEINFLDYDNFDCKLMEAFSIMNYVLENWKLDEIFLCFNGGKDCTVVLHLFYSLLSKFHLNEFEYSKITFLYIKENAIRESEFFLYQTVLFYGASLVELDSSQGFIQSCMDFSRMHPKKIICLMGNRKTDHALNSLQSFQQTDEGWPRFLRVFPIINFDYADVWKYIQKFSVPYCKLYSQGYTSIGSLNKTRKNETLRINGSDKCLHASELTDVSSERNFR